MIGRLFKPRESRSLENPNTPISGIDCDSDLYNGGCRSSSGVAVTQTTALGYAPFWRAINLVSRDVAKLPLNYFVRTTGEGRERDRTTGIWGLAAKQPNSFMTQFIFRETLQAHVMTYGNGYAWIRRQGDGTPIELIPLSPASTYPVLETVMDGDERVTMLWYVVSIQANVQGGQAISQRKVSADDIIHVKGLGFDGLVGYDVVSFHKETLGLGIGARKYGSIYFKNNARPSIVLEHPALLDDQAAKRLKLNWETMHRGLDEAHRTAVLEEGMQAKMLSDPAKQSQLTDVRQMEVREVANVTNVPIHKLGDPTGRSFASLEQESQSYLDESIDPWLVMWEQEYDQKLLTESQKRADSHFFEFNRNALVRANFSERTAGYNTALLGGWMSPDEVRARENLNPIPDDEGNVYYRPLNVAVVGEGAPDDPTTDAASRMAQAAQISLVDAVRRITTRIGIQATRAAKHPTKWLEWVDGLEDSNSQHFADYLEPASRMLGCLDGSDPQTHLDKMGKEYFEAMRDMLLRASDCKKSEFAGNVESLTRQAADYEPRRLAGLWLENHNGTQVLESSNG